jgi:hypothetical protein
MQDEATRGVADARCGMMRLAPMQDVRCGMEQKKTVPVQGNSFPDFLKEA